MVASLGIATAQGPVQTMTTETQPTVIRFGNLQSFILKQDI